MKEKIFASLFTPLPALSHKGRGREHYEVLLSLLPENDKFFPPLFLKEGQGEIIF